MYQVLIGGVPFPMGPSKIVTNTGSRSQTIELINGQEVNLVRGPKLREWTIDVTLPSQNYPYIGLNARALGGMAGNIAGALSTTLILEYLESLKNDKVAFPLIILRLGENFNVTTFDNLCQKVTLEEYSITEDATNGQDMELSLSFKEFIPFSTKVYNSNGTIGKERT